MHGKYGLWQKLGISTPILCLQFDIRYKKPPRPKKNIQSKTDSVNYEPSLPCHTLAGKFITNTSERILLQSNSFVLLAQHPIMKMVLFWNSKVTGQHDARSRHNDYLNKCDKNELLIDWFWKLQCRLTWIHIIILGLYSWTQNNFLQVCLAKFGVEEASDSELWPFRTSNRQTVTNWAHSHLPARSLRVRSPDPCDCI